MQIMTTAPVAATAGPIQAGSSSISGRSCHCIIKLGGSAITAKSQLETLKAGVLQHICHSIRQLHEAVPGGIVLVHGAGSFGHFQANQYQVAHGGTDRHSAIDGFVQTRQSVTKLNHLVVSALVAAGVPAVGLSPCGAWATSNRQPDQTSAGIAAVQALLHQGLVPVLHGDCVLDSQLGVTILSGDTIIRVLAEELKPQYCVFLTDVAGLYAAPPDVDPHAQLIPLVEVHADGSWQVPTAGAAAAGDGCCSSSRQLSVQLSAAEHDTTGGIATKIREAAGVVVTGCPVVIAQAGTQAGVEAVLRGPAAFTTNLDDSNSPTRHQNTGTVLRLAG